MLNVTFLPEAWEDYLYWQSKDKKTLKRINLIIKEVNRDYFTGIGKPEPLKGNLAGCGVKELMIVIGWYIGLKIICC